MATGKRVILTLDSKVNVIRQHEKRKKKYPLSKGHPPYKANLMPAERVAL